MAKIKTKARALLENHDALVQRRYVGDMAASDELLDLATAIEKAGLTERQAQVIKLRYVDDLSKTQAAKNLGIAVPTLHEFERLAIDKIDSVYGRWEARENRSAAQKRFELLLRELTLKEAV